MKATDKALLIKGLKSFLITALVMFTAPVVLYQAFRNQEHMLFWPVLSIGLIFAVLAIYLGFRSVNIILKALFGN